MRAKIDSRIDKVLECARFYQQHNHNNNEMSRNAVNAKAFTSNYAAKTR